MPPNEKTEQKVGEQRLTPLEAATKAFYDFNLKKAVKNIEKKQINHELVHTVGQNLERDSDRSCAIILFSMIDEILQDLILDECNNSIHRLRNRMFDIQSGMLPSSTRRIFFVIALEWITKDTFHNLNIIRKIRNEFAHNIACDTFAYPKIRSFLASISPTHREIVDRMINAALAGRVEAEKLSDIFAEYDKKGRFFFIVECVFILDRLVAEISIFPEARRQWVSPGDVMQDLESMPENLQEMRRSIAGLLLDTTVSTFQLVINMGDDTDRSPGKCSRPVPQGS